jgi:hypothetical protein
MIRPSGMSNSFIGIERMHADFPHQGNKGNEAFARIVIGLRGGQVYIAYAT